MSPDGSMKSPLPEEKLLKLIRGKGPRPARPGIDDSRAGEPGASASAAAGGREAPGAIVGSRPASVPATSWPTLIVACLGVMVGIEFVVLVVQAVRPLPALTPPVVAAPARMAPAPAAVPPREIPSLAESAARPLFTPPAVTSEAAAAPRMAPSSSAQQLASRLTLLGIVPGDPAQAIIEDAETKKTYFVTTGQAVVEGALLDQVLENHVVLDLHGEKIDLTL